MWFRLNQLGRQPFIVRVDCGANVEDALIVVSHEVNCMGYSRDEWTIKFRGDLVRRDAWIITYNGTSMEDPLLIVLPEPEGKWRTMSCDVWT